jgi:hypothetical protein
MTMLLFKDGVQFKQLEAQMLLALQVVQAEFSRYGLDTVITAGTDGKHMPGSLHYVGRALDFRTKHAVGAMQGIFLNVKKALLPLGFDVLWESQGQEVEHLHVEFDPKY